MLSWPGAGGEWFHPRYIPVAPTVWIGCPCIPLLSFKKCLGGLVCPRGSESLPPRPYPYTPRSSLRVPDGTYPRKSLQPRLLCSPLAASLVTWPLLKHVAPSLHCLLPTAHALGWGTHGWDPSMYLPNKHFSSSPLLTPTPASSTHTRLHKKHKPKMQYMN